VLFFQKTQHEIFKNKARPMKHSGISQLTIDKQEQKLEQQLKEELGLNTNHSYWKPYLTHQKKKNLTLTCFPFPLWCE
jgi:hypothetical protein